MKIAVAGAGYVGLSLAVLLAQKHEVRLVEIRPERVKLINNHQSPIRDPEIEDFLAHKSLHLSATTDWHTAFWDAELIIVATPTNYDDVNNAFDTTNVEDIIRKALLIRSDNPRNHADLVIKSTVPVGYTEMIKRQYGIENILFSPEFLREGHALYDNLYPSRIIIGTQSNFGKTFASLLLEGAVRKDTPVKYMRSTEAEAVKLFANTYLAVRVAFFNELDTYAETKGLSSKDIIEGVCLDPRIGMHYNNPSFGYGGYCLPKDTKQLYANYGDIPQALIGAAIESNRLRKQHIVQEILATGAKNIGIYRLVMKHGSDNFRSSAMQDIIAGLNHHANLVIYEPTLDEDTFNGIPVERNFQKFKADNELIVTNRAGAELSDVASKIYTRDIYARD